MQVKKFEAPTIQEALETIKRELGPEAIILQTKKYKRGFGLMSKASVEVTAAVSERSLQKKTFAESRLPESTREASRKLSANRQADMHEQVLEKHLEKAAATRDKVSLSKPGHRMTATRYIDIDAPPARPPVKLPPASGATAAPVGAMGLDAEVRHLKRMIEEIKSAQESTGPGSATSGATAGTLSSAPVNDAFEQMVINGVDKRFALQVARNAAFELGSLGPELSQDPERVLDQFATEIMRATEVISPLQGVEPGKGDGPVVIALVGPTGVGKTTTVAKMASEALLRRNLKVGLINLDSYKIAAFDQLGTYAKILHVPFRSVATAEDLKAAMADFSALDLVIIDTTGRSQRDPGSLKEMHDTLSAISEVRAHLVLAVTTRDAELYDMASRFSIFRPQGLILSKLDEATIYGSIFNVTQRMKLPLLYFTTGQRVPEDIEEATRERVAALILEL